jgi:hypothetical protein
VHLIILDHVQTTFNTLMDCAVPKVTAVGSLIEGIGWRVGIGPVVPEKCCEEAVFPALSTLWALYGGDVVVA